MVDAKGWWLDYRSNVCQANLYVRLAIEKGAFNLRLGAHTVRYEGKADVMSSFGIKCYG